MVFRSSELPIWNKSEQSMINQYLMLNKVCFVAKTKWMVWNGVLCTNEFCVQSDDQKPY